LGIGKHCGLQVRWFDGDAGRTHRSLMSPV
jgi:hypothetical protein